jgi:hypothetical protein
MSTRIFTTQVVTVAIAAVVKLMLIFSPTVVDHLMAVMITVLAWSISQRLLFDRLDHSQRRHDARLWSRLDHLESIEDEDIASRIETAFGPSSAEELQGWDKIFDELHKEANFDRFWEPLLAQWQTWQPIVRRSSFLRWLILGEQTQGKRGGNESPEIPDSGYDSGSPVV